MGKKGKELAKERRLKRLQELSQLRKLPIPLCHRWWSSSETVAVVTGSSRGIGLEIARQLSAYGLLVVVAARDADLCRQSAERLREEEGSASVEWRRLDVSDRESVDSFADWVRARFGGVDVLVNNAGVNFNYASDNSVEFAETVITTNYIGTKRMIEAMIPLMKPSAHGARILNVGSRLGRINGRRNRLADATLRDQFTRDDCLSEELIDGMVAKFLEHVREGTWASKGWPQMYTDYSVSKLAVNTFTRLMARELSSRPEGQKIYINCYCPGWVKTAMTNWEGNMTAEEGADTGVWVVLMPQGQSVQGKFFAERREISF
ncbi:carbonyl reductase [NADPH] 1-like [Iris pallida]|uniref:Carbonyl reductase [NADPH] 1-like n=1 Tax=Iris pallida TaxID=29817 RepID=A0AAX6HJS8_IRIPA|nr:carbonyl reductase [NADPH] 1-like [Iris pallida]